jgi:2-iminobutanoate/2-iminopropanoate deaminase
MADHITLSGGASEAAPYSDAVVSDGCIYVAGQLAQDDPAWRGRSGTIEEETKAAMDLIGRVLKRAGADYPDIVRVGVFMTDLAESTA